MYLDYASTTPVRKEVVDAMLPYFSEKFANPSSIHEAGVDVKEDIEIAREEIKLRLNASNHKVIFTGSATESINLALKGIARASKRKHIITSKVEHKSVLETCKSLEEEGFEVTYLDVDSNGVVSVDAVRNAIREETALVSIQYVNNETGVIQPVREIAALCKEKGAVFHTDACQAGYLDLSLGDISAMTLNGSKIYGSKGVGVLVINEDVTIKSLVQGGGQEGGLRSGTHNVPGIIGFSKALSLMSDGKEVRELQELFESKVVEIEDCVVNGVGAKRAPHISSISFKRVLGEDLLNHLSAQGIYVSTGSACANNEVKTSHVLLAMDVDEEYLKGTIRVSFGFGVSKENVLRAVEVIREVVESLRRI